MLNPKRATTAAAGYGGLLTESELLAISLFRLRRAAPPSSLSACFKLMCRLGMGRPATRAASCSAADSGRTASASSGYIGSIMCPVVCERSPPEYASSGADPSSGHQARMLVRGPGGSDDVAAKRCSCSRALAGLAVSDPKARSALHIWKEGKSSNHNRRFPHPTEASSGHDLTSVDTSGRPSGVSFSIKRDTPDVATTGSAHTGAFGGGKGRCRTGDAQAQAEGKPAIDRTSRRRVQVVARLVAHSACNRVLPVSPPQKSHIWL